MIIKANLSARHWIVLAVVAGLFGWLFSDTLVGDRNFVYRDASQFYYPLLRLVQEQWESGLWPLWNPHENSGMPLLGNPASAVLYPPRIVLFQWLPWSYAAAFKWYTLGHVLFCAWTAWLLARRFGISELGSGLAAISYAFGAAVLFQYCNVIFLVGAAWVPLGMLAADRALGGGDWRWACLVGAVLAMQMLGGDPEAAYITGGIAAIYLALIDRYFALASIAGLSLLYVGKWLVRVAVAKAAATPHPTGSVAGWDSITGDHLLLALMVGCLLVVPVLWRRSVRSGVRVGGALAWRRRGCLALAAGCAAGLSAVQWIPSWEFGRISNRAAGGVHYEPYAFWIAPWRIFEFFWPNVLGQEFPIQARWANMIPADDKLWEPSLYFGSAAAVLAYCACGLVRTTVWQRWLTVILIFSLWASTGPAGGISWYRSFAAQLSQQPNSPDQAAAPQAKQPGTMQTPAGGLYWAMIELLPGFDTFRYPAKLLTFSAIAFAVLAGAGWDRFFNNDPRLSRWFAIIAGLSVLFAAAWLIARPWLIRAFADSTLARGTPYYGPLIPNTAWMCSFAAFLSTAILFGLLWLIQRRNSQGKSRWLAAAALALVAVDLALANRWLIVTSPQPVIDAVPELVTVLRDAEAQDEDRDPVAPMRVYRISIWSPPKWAKASSTDQPEAIFRWEKETVQPKHGLPFGINYAINEGTLEPYDYWWFFAPFYSNMTPVPRSVVYYPQRGFDMWGAKYFILPHGYDATDQYRGFRTFLKNSTLVAESHVLEDDYQVRRNHSVYPRAWIVHQIHYRTPVYGLAKSDRMHRMREILYEGFDGLWSEPMLDSQVQDPRRVVWIEHPDPSEVMAYHDTGADPAGDRCRVVEYRPNRVELEAETGSRGVVVLADVLYPGWEVKVDGAPAAIWRANRLMRGVPILPGKHRIVFEFKPKSVQLGAVISVTTLAILALLVLITVSFKSATPFGRR